MGKYKFDDMGTLNIQTEKLAYNQLLIKNNFLGLNIWPQKENMVISNHLAFLSFKGNNVILQKSQQF